MVIENFEIHNVTNLNYNLRKYIKCLMKHYKQKKCFEYYISFIAVYNDFILFYYLTSREGKRST